MRSAHVDPENTIISSIPRKQRKIIIPEFEPIRPNIARPISTVNPFPQSFRFDMMIRFASPCPFRYTFRFPRLHPISPEYTFTSAQNCLMQAKLYFLERLSHLRVGEYPSLPDHIYITWLAMYIFSKRECLTPLLFQYRAFF